MNVNFNHIRIIVNQKYDSMKVEVWVIQNDGIDQFNISQHFENGLVFTKIEELQLLDSDSLKPFLELPMIFADGLFKAISEYNSSKGIQTKDQNLLEGKLGATEKHLEDMREMSKKLLEAVINIKPL